MCLVTVIELGVGTMWYIGLVVREPPGGRGPCVPSDA